jgi:hypothetical protein
MDGTDFPQTSPSWSKARQKWCRSPLIFTKTSSRCYSQRLVLITQIRCFRISPSNTGPNRRHQNRTISWLISMPRSCRRSSTFRSESGNRTYSITAKRMNSGLVSKVLKGGVWSTVDVTQHLSCPKLGLTDGTESGNQTKSITARRMMSRPVLKRRTGSGLLTLLGYESALPAAGKFALTVPYRELCSATNGLPRRACDLYCAGVIRFAEVNAS